MDPCSVLGLDRSADLEEIRRAYLKLAELHHPDRGGDPKRFKLIREAYEQLLRRPPPPPPKGTVSSAAHHPRFESRPINKKSRRRKNSPLAVTCWSVSLIPITTLSIYLISSVVSTSDSSVAETPASKGHVQDSEALPDKKKRPDLNTEAVVNPNTIGEKPHGEFVQMESILPARDEQKAKSNSIDNAESSYSTEFVRQREPLPTVTDQQNPRRTVARLFKARYVEANTRDSKIELASKIFEAARDEEDFATKYVLLEIAKGIAVRNIDINLALSSAEEIERIFDVETGSILNATVSDLSATLANADSINSDLADEVLFLLMTFANNSIVDGNVVQANAWLLQARDVAKMVRRTGLETRIETLLDAVREEATHQSELANAIKMLASEPENSDANHLVGKDLCLRGEWKEGFSRLRLSSESEIKRLADSELKADSDTETQEELADLWWAYTSEDPKLAKLAKDRARYHYLAAISSAKGLAKLKIESRLSQLSADRLLHTYTSNSEPGADRAKASGFQRPHDAIVIENRPVYFIPFSQSSNIQVSRDKADTHVHYRVDYADDKAIVQIFNALPTVVSLEIHLSQGAGSKLARPGLDLSRLSKTCSIPAVVVTWANRVITGVTWDRKAVPQLEEVEVEKDSIKEQLTYELPPVSLDIKLFCKAHQIIKTQIVFARKNKVPQGYVILGNEFMDGHDCSALLPLRIVYGPVFIRRNNSLVLEAETASVVFDAGVGADGKERIVVTQLKHAIGQPWEGDPIPSREAIGATTYVTEKNGMKSGRYLEDQ